MNTLPVIILAAGLGKRMRSRVCKVLHPLAGRPMILYPVDLARRVGGRPIVTVVGYQAEEVKRVLAGRGVTTVLQTKQLGTGHAVLHTARALSRCHGTLLILNGDTPLLTEHTVRRLLSAHQEGKAAITLLTARVPSPHGYGRVVRSPAGDVQRVVEEASATETERKTTEINVGVYAVEASFVYEALKEIAPDKVTREYYLPDIVRVASVRGLTVRGISTEDPREALGINTRVDLSVAEQVLRRRIAEKWMLEGVTLLDPRSTFIDSPVTIGRDTVIYPDTFLEGETTIGEGCVICPHVRITDSHLEDRVTVRDSCVITSSHIASEAAIGPFAHLRPGTIVKKGARIGNFVEVKKTEMGEGSKANHLSYLGDAVIGKDVNIGAGTITCNYDGVKKHRTVIGDAVFVGSDTQFIAPVKVGRGAVIAAGATVTKDVPPGALAISRVEQVNKAGWARQRGKQAHRSRPKTRAKRK